LNAPAPLELNLGGEGVDRLQAARVATLYGAARSVYVASPLAAAVVLLLLWDLPAHDVLLGWMACVVAISLGRLALHRAYLHAAEAPREPLAWERRFALGALAAGAVWTLPLAVLFPLCDPPQQFALLFAATGSMVGAGGVYAVSALTFYAFSTLPLGAMAVQLLAQPDRTYRVLGVVVLVFAVAMVRVFRDIQRSIVGALRARTEKEALLERVAESEARLRDAIEGFPGGLAVYDEHDRLVVCNAGYARDYGRGRDAAALAGVPYHEICEAAFDAEQFAPGQAPAREAWIAERMARRRRPDNAREYRLPDGRWMQGRFVGTRRGGSVSLYTDVTALKSAQAAYQAVLAEEHLVLDALPVGVAFVENRVIVRCNARLEHMLGYGPGELAGRPARVLYPSEEAWRSAGATLYEELRGGGIFEGEGPLARKDGARLWCHALVRAIVPGAPQDSVIAVFSDESERRAAQQALRRSESLYRSLVETSNDLVWSIDGDGRWSYLNPDAVRRIYGAAAPELLGQPWHDAAVQTLRERDRAVFGRVLRGEPVFGHETRHRRRDGSAVDLAFNAVPLHDARGAIIGATGTARDISEERAASAALHESVEKLRLAVDAAELVYWEWDRASGTLHWGSNPSGVAGIANGRTLPWNEYLQLVHPQDRERYLADATAAWERNQPYAAEYRVRGRDGKEAWISARGKALTDAAGAATRMIGVSQDVTARKQREEEERFLAYHDTLTGLPNRRLLEDRLRQALHLAQRRDARVAVMLVDLDDFKRVNDELGHRAGDAVLREVAERLAGCVRKADTLARQGGDEFVVVMPDLGQETRCEVVAGKLLRALEPAFHAEGREYRIGASIGISIYPGDAGDGEALLRNADAAMYRAKQAGRNRYRFYSR
jgi:diguanylate cyclase (GGDEF)-like protein/PAS domain S-box-containing protein